MGSATSELKNGFSALYEFSHEKGAAPQSIKGTVTKKDTDIRVTITLNVPTSAISVYLENVKKSTDITVLSNVIDNLYEIAESDFSNT